MKKLSVLLAILALAVCASGLSGCGKQADPDAPSGMVLASGDDADYICYMPDGWKIDKSTLYTSAYFSAGDATSISVTAYGLKYTDTAISDWWSDFLTETEKVYSDVTVSDPEDCELDGVSAQKYAFTATLDGQEYDYIITAAVKSNYVYYVTYTSTPDYYEDHLEALDSVIGHFEFK